MLCMAANRKVLKQFTPCAALKKVKTPSCGIPEKNPVKRELSLEILSEKYEWVKKAIVRTMLGLNLANNVLTLGRGNIGISNWELSGLKFIASRKD